MEQVSFESTAVAAEDSVSSSPPHSLLHLVLSSRCLHRYNEQVVARFVSGLLPSAVVVVSTAYWFAACAAPLGPGYIVEKQEIRVTFVPRPEARIRIAAEYHLKNSGNQELSSLDVRLPGRRFHPAAMAISWEGGVLDQSASADNPRDTLLRFPQPWQVGARHTLRFAYDISSVNAPEGAIGFSSDAFFLPAGGWTPALPQARGVFGFGGVPPKNWELFVRVPQGFLVHASGGKEKRSRQKEEMQFRFAQSAEDLNPFVIAGNYHETHQDLPQNQKVRIWSRAELNPSEFQQAGDSLSRTLASYDALFGARGKSRPTLWIVECLAQRGCLSRSGTGYSALLDGENAEDSAEMISRDTVLIDPRVSHGKPETVAGPALAAGWLGYGRNPGFYEQQPPMSALPAFAAALAREISSGPQIREEIVRRALARIPAHPMPESNNDPAVIRAKSLLLFYALRDRVGTDPFQKAIQHMLSARQSRDFDITDFISALEQESHQNIGPFIRQWIKRPGIPEDFRAAYSQPQRQQNLLSQEAVR